MKYIFLLLVLFVFVFSSVNSLAVTPPKKKTAEHVQTTSQAEQQEGCACPNKGDCKAKGSEVEEDDDYLPYVLDHRERPSRKYIGEFDIFGGDYLGDETKNTWGVGARTLFHINHIFSMGAEYVYAPMSADPGTVFNAPDYDKNQHLVTAQFVFNNEAAIAFGRTAIPLDLYLTIGGGTGLFNNQWKWLTMIGGGLKIYLGAEWFALRFDVNSYIHPIPKGTGDSINSDMAIWLGTAIHFPNKKSKPEI